MALRIRPALPEEHDAVGALTVRAYQDGAALADPDSGYTAELVDAGRRAREAELVVVVDDARPDELLATVTVCRPGSPWAEVARDGELELRMLAVAPEHRGRGVARAVMARMRAIARDEGSVIVVSVVEGNPAARALYEGLGFVREPDRDWRPSATVSLLVYRDVPSGTDQAGQRNVRR